MRTDTVLRCDGMRILAEHLGIVEAERFVTLIRREPFDYTEWRQNLFNDVPLEKFLEDAKHYSENLVQ
ncbi:MAG: hypothetical protein FWE67_14820 [Planctomycetaceae bacterium]|nr:hypothetical protein [Planctomycetaceae bacterium]